MDLTNAIPVPGDLLLQPNHATIVSVLLQRAILHPEKRAFTFLVDGTDKELFITYGELDACARKVAMKLSDLGYKGKKVLMFYPAGLESLIAATPVEVIKCPLESSLDSLFEEMKRASSLIVGPGMGRDKEAVSTLFLMRK